METPEPLAASDADVWKITERSVASAASRSQMWLAMARRAYDRTCHGGSVDWGIVTESWSFVLAIDHVRGCAESAKGTATVVEAKNILTKALQAFDDAQPDVRNLRDVLEHFDDDYRLGRGKLQQPKASPHQRLMNQALAEEWTISYTFLDPASSQRPSMTAGPLMLTFDGALVEADRLMMAVYRAAQAQGIEPT